MKRNIKANQILEMGFVTDANSVPKLPRNLFFLAIIRDTTFSVEGTRGGQHSEKSGAVYFGSFVVSS